MTYGASRRWGWPRDSSGCVLLPALLASFAVATGGSSPALAQTSSRAIRAAAWVTPEGEIEKNAVVLVTDGRIAAVGEEPPKDVPIDEYERAVISPGLIDCHASLGAVGHLRETAQPLEPSARARDAFDRFHPHLRVALQAGVTTFALCPDDGNVIGGRIAICQTYGAALMPAVLVETGPMKLSLSSAAFLPDREPTSRSGALGMLRTALSQAASPGAADSPLRGVPGGATRIVASAPAGADVLAMLGLVDEFKLKAVVVHSVDARDIAAEAARRDVGVIAGPLDFSSPPRLAQAPGILAQAGVRMAIAGGLPTAPADSLRIGAAVAVRNGLSPAAGRTAITSAAAELLGVSDLVGSIAPGLRADLVVFSGDPLDLRSRVLAVYVGGVRVPRDATAAGR